MTSGRSGDSSSLCVILAAGEGKRMKSDLPKVAHPVLGVPMVERVVLTARSAGLQALRPTLRK